MDADIYQNSETIHPLLITRLLTGLVFAGFAVATGAAEIRAIVANEAGEPIADAVVFAYPLQGHVPVADAAHTPAIMDQRDSEFVPYVLPVRTGTPVTFPNSDNLKHHVYSFSPAKRFELPLYRGLPPKPVVFDKPGPVVLGCNIHDWMVGYIYVLDTPYFDKTGADGSARLANLPPREYKLRVWHPHLRVAEKNTERVMAANTHGTTHVKFVIALKPDLRKPRRAVEDSSDTGSSYGY